MSKNKEVIVEVNGLKIRKDSVYQVDNKLDNNAPTGYIKEGATKLPSLGIFNGIQVRYVKRSGSDKGVYDTGLYEESPCYAGKDKEEVKKLVSKLRKVIVEPYERKYGKGILDNDNEDFWNNYIVKLEAGRPFVTSNVDDLLDLYIAMLTYELTPKGKVNEGGKEGHPKFKDSQFTVVDKSLSRSYEQETNAKQVDAIINFGILLKTDRSLLLNILRYIGMIDVNQDYDDETLKSSFQQWLKTYNDNTDRFLRAYKLADTEEGKEELNFYSVVAKLAQKGVIKYTNNSYYYNGVELGASLKAVAKRIANSKEYEPLKIELLEK